MATFDGIEEKEIKSSMGLAALGRKCSGQILSGEKIEARKTRKEKLVGRDRLTSFYRGIEEIRKENVFCSCMSILFAAIRYAPVYKSIQLFIDYVCNHVIDSKTGKAKYNARYFQNIRQSIKLPYSMIFEGFAHAGINRDLTSKFIIEKCRKNIMDMTRISDSVTIKITKIFEFIQDAKSDESEEFFKTSSEYLIRDTGYSLAYFQTMTNRIKLSVFNLYMRRMREILGNDLTAEYWIGTLVNLVKYGNALKLTEALASPLLPVRAAHSFIPSVNETFNITKDFFMLALETTRAMFEMVIFDNIDPVWEDMYSRFFILGILKVIPGIWGLPDSYASELSLQYDLADTFLHYKLESIRFGIKEALSERRIDDMTLNVIQAIIYRSSPNEATRDEFLESLSDWAYNEHMVDVVIEEAAKDQKILKQFLSYQIQEIPLVVYDGVMVYLEYDDGQREEIGIKIADIIKQKSLPSDQWNKYVFDATHILSNRGVVIEDLPNHSPDAVYITRRESYYIESRPENIYGSRVPILVHGQLYQFKSTRYYTEWENPSVLHRASMLGENFSKGYKVFVRMLELGKEEKVLKEFEAPLREVRRQYLARIANLVENFKNIDYDSDEAVGNYLRLLSQLCDPVTYHHSRNVFMNYANVIRRLQSKGGLKTGLSTKQIQQFSVAALVHDAGKAIVGEEILHKTGKLTRDEAQEIRNHSEYSEVIAQSLGLPDKVRTIVRGHHEKYNGMGYPDGLTAHEIEDGTPILVVLDVFEAISSRILSQASRGYLMNKRSMTIPQIVEVITKDCQTKVMSPYYAWITLETLLEEGYCCDDQIISFEEFREDFLGAINFLKEMDKKWRQSISISLETGFAGNWRFADAMP